MILVLRQKIERQQFGELPLGPVGLVLIAVISLLVFGGFTWLSISHFAEVSDVLASGGGLIIYDPDMFGWFFVDAALVFVLILPIRDRIAEHVRDTIAIIIVGVIVFGVFGAPFFARDYYNARIAAAGYSACFDHPAQTGSGGYRRSWLPNEVWVLDPADCDPGDDWSREEYHRQARLSDDDGSLQPKDDPRREQPTVALDPDLMPWAIPPGGENDGR